MIGRVPMSGMVILLLSIHAVSAHSHATLQEMLNIFDLSDLEGLLNNTNIDISEQCGWDVDTMLQALQEKKMWALKAYDASGRYSNGFFWGNGYWVGSETLCLNIQSPSSNYEVNGEIPTTATNLTALVHEQAPISLGFYKIRNLLTPPSNISPPKTILLGLCLPLSCSAKDVKTLLQLSTSRRSSTTIEIQRVKTPHETYMYSQDPVFWILGVTSTIIYIFLVVGTILDYFIERREERKMCLQYTSKNFTTPSPPEKLPTSLDYQGDAMTTNCSNKFDSNSNSVTLTTIEGSSMSSEVETELWQDVLLAFSVRRNLKTIWDRSVGEDTIPTVHGIRFFSMCWVVLGHTCIIIFKYSDNMEFRGLMEQQWVFQTITNAPFAVDSFFFISGLLVSFLYFRTTSKIDVTKLTKSVGFKSNVIQFFGLIIYRFCRLTSPYLFILGCVQVSMQYFQHNSVFDPPTNDHINCPEYWWRNALYINTLFPVEQMCMLWSWYLADDTQFYILGLFLLITAVNHLKAAAGLLLAFLASSWFTTAYVAYTNNHKPSLDDPLTLFDKIYDKPWTRLGPYLIGMIVGWVLFKYDNKIKMNKASIGLGWICSIAGMMSLVYGLHGQDLSLFTSSAYSSLSHTVWAMCLAWIVIACSLGYGGVINKLLSSSSLYPFSRVTYCAYLVHPVVIRQIIITIDSPLHLSQTFMLILYLGVLSASYGISFLVSLMFEAPIVSLLRLLSPKRSKKSLG